jgi:leucyl-tRNA synthetase
MAQSYSDLHSEIDSRWQKIWQDKQAFKASFDPAEKSPKPKFYALDMFPYPSGYGLHIGHMASYTPTDVVARYKRARGFNVLHPMGYDAFGLPAEQYAIQTGIHPALTTQKSIETFRRQLQAFGFSFDWSREISTAEPNFYKWTQFIFTKLFEKGLAYQKEVPVNWCPALRTVLANEEVVDGKSERGGHPVVRVPMKQWMLKITAYAERLINDLDKVDWPQRTKEAQLNWIGKSEGASVLFDIEGFKDQLEIFTTRPDTLFGATFMVISPEHPLLKKIVPQAQRSAVDDYVQLASRKSEVDRKAATDKSGIFTGAYALHPLTQKRLPIWTADYVLMDYGSGAIMAVPAHDQRDYEFAQKFGLEIQRVLETPDSEASTNLPYEGDGLICHSDFLNGLTKSQAIQTMIDRLEKDGRGKRMLQYKLRDWLFSRQRYWGEPFPIVNFSTAGLRSLPLAELPVVLPEVADYQPSEKGEAPLARNKEWMQYKDPLTGEEGHRESDTMPGSAGSSWYFLRYCDPHNSTEAFSFEAQKYWMPVDLYVGGPEHTVGHLLYARFWQKVLFDAGLVSTDEPFQKLAHQGMILGTDGEKMSKSRGNVVNPDEMRERFGADALRLYILFLGPMDRDKPWSETGIDGVQRFLDRVWRLIVNDEGRDHTQQAELPDDLKRSLHKTIKKVGEDIEALSFNTAISALMILVNEVYKTSLRPRELSQILLQLLAPLAPHMCEELWSRMGQKDLIALAAWPQYESNLTVDSVVTIGVQVNGKSRGAIQIEKEASEVDAVAAAMEVSTVVSALAGKPVDKVIYKAGRILNLIVKA